MSHELLPLGKIIGIAELLGCVPASGLAKTLGRQELAFGDYSAGRWAWQFTGFFKIPNPIECKGSLGIWRIGEGDRFKLMKECGIGIPFAISLTQPWATLLASGQKRIETRSWKTPLRGLIAIHASKGFPKGCQALCVQSPFAEALNRIFDK